MRRQGLDVAQVGAFVGAFYLPWAFKWSWAPLVDLVRLARFGGRKAWIVLCQVLMIATLFGVSQIDYHANFDLLITLVLVHNVFSATQDVAIDALAINTLAEDERATANGLMFGGAYIGQGLGGGGAMFVSEWWGFDVSFLYVSALLLGILVFTLLFLRDPSLGSRAIARAGGIWSGLAANLAGFVRELGAGFFRSGVGPLVGVAFALLPLGAMALSGAVSSTLQVDLGMSDGQIAQLNIYQTVLSGVGCVVGGWFADRYGQRRTLIVWYLLTALPTLYVAAVMSAAVFMGLTNPLVAATQFTGYMALRNLVISYTNVWQGALADSHGYAAVFYLDAALVLLPVLLIPFLRPTTRGRPDPKPMAAPLPEAG
jgi:PAT family beta-lactamase induction signal transducer AmpG